LHVVYDLKKSNSGLKNEKYSFTEKVENLINETLGISKLETVINAVLAEIKYISQLINH